MKRLLFLVPFLVLVACNRELLPNPDPNHIHADFAVWIDGKQLDFSDPKYMSTPPADTSAFFPLITPAFAHGDVEDGHTVEGREYVHLHDGNGHVIHGHKPGLTIGDFFTSIGFTLTPECFTFDTGTSLCTSGEERWHMFVNGNEIPVNPGYVFKDLDQILLTYGSTPDEVLRQVAQLTDDSCRYSKRCPWKGDVPVENCISDPAIPCTVPPEDL